MFKILVVEDLREVYEPLCRILDDEGFATDIATNQSDAIRLIEEKGSTYDLALVDLILGNDGNGYAVLGVADRRGIPVIFLTALTDEYNMANGYDRGAYDYICKPYKPIVLISRIKSVLRKSGKLQSELVCRDLVVDMSRAVVTKNGRELPMQRIHYKLLLLFMNNLGRVLSREWLADQIYDYAGEWINDNTLSVHIKRLRESIGDDPKEPQYIRTVRGIGYIMDA